MEVDKWEKSIYDECLKLEDVRKMRKGDRIKLLLLDHGIWDIVGMDNKPNKLYTLEYFFRRNWAIYVHDEGIKGSMSYYWSRDFEPFEFEIMEDERVGRRGLMLRWDKMVEMSRVYYRD
jgi:hypothetical protein